MADRFAAYSFVDRITELTPGTRARGIFAVPADIAPLSSCLVAEAVGQLAAWVAMSQVSFRGRPVAALANETLLTGDVSPGSLLELAVEIEDCDDDAVAYAGWANVDGKRVIALNECLGPMLPVEEFDSPDELRERFELLRGAGAPPGRFRGVSAPRIVDGDHVPGKSATATLYVPESAPFFADHFPRRPVFPATLLLDAQIRLALRLAGNGDDSSDGTKLVPSRMTHVKMRSFVAPGDVLLLTAERAPSADAAYRILMSAQSNGKSIATARVELARKES